MKKIYLIAGEPSGDLHGAHLVDALRRHYSEIEFRGFGGLHMEAAGVRLDQTIDQLSFMGFSEVIKHLPTIWSNFRLAKKNILKWNPDAIIYIDFPGFNMRMARWARKRGFTNFYYIAPQVWAWKEQRALKLKRDIDELFCILPFEKSFFARFDYNVHYVGHPLVDIISEYKAKNIVPAKEKSYGDQPQNISADPNPYQAKKIIALLPGSRKQEVKKTLPVQLQAVSKMKDYHIIIGKSAHVPQVVYDQIVSEVKDCRVSYDTDTYLLLRRAWLASVASGTATLETALFKVPQVVCFRGSVISYVIARRLVRISFISLVNLILDKKVVPELIQHKFTAENLRDELQKLTLGSKRVIIEKHYNELEDVLGVGGAATRTAKIIISRLGI